MATKKYISEILGRLEEVLVAYIRVSAAKYEEDKMDNYMNK